MDDAARGGAAMSFNLCSQLRIRSRPASRALDIFDLPTFTHLAAETAAEYARRPLRSFPPIHVHSHSPGSLKSFHVPEIPPSNAAASARSRASSDDDREFRRLVREMHEEERKELIRADPSLIALQKQTESYRKEKDWLEKSYDAKLANLEREFDQLQRRNVKLHQLSQKVHGIAAEHRLRSLSGCGSGNSSYASSPSTPYRRASQSSHTSNATSSAASSAPSSRQSTPPGSPVSIL
jgi:hypothetical protein